ncbi:MAG: peptidoglycan-associated lipoprotein Pal [Alphaproteobacteria bacterium]|nr:peptidoglycan-associated lipoprotein Pal [Alphaproteobacteria bacterium]
MRLKHLCLLSLVIMVAACADKKAPVQQANVDQSQYEPYVEDGHNVQPGSIEDFRVNVGDRVFFGYNHQGLTPAARETLERQAGWLKQYADVKVIIEGHCDERGTREYNLALGERRAHASKHYLISLGIPASRIQTLSFGKDKPENPASNEEAWSQNRRAVTIITEGAH